MPLDIDVRHIPDSSQLANMLESLDTLSLSLRRHSVISLRANFVYDLFSIHNSVK